MSVLVLRQTAFEHLVGEFNERVNKLKLYDFSRPSDLVYNDFSGKERAMVLFIYRLFRVHRRKSIAKGAIQKISENGCSHEDFGTICVKVQNWIRTGEKRITINRLFDKYENLKTYHSGFLKAAATRVCGTVVTRILDLFNHQGDDWLSRFVAESQTTGHSTSNSSSSSSTADYADQDSTSDIKNATQSTPGGIKLSRDVKISTMGPTSTDRRCVICDSNPPYQSLSGGSRGRQNVLDAAFFMNDTDVINRIHEDGRTEFMYHSRATRKNKTLLQCYASYLLKKSYLMKKPHTDNSQVEEDTSVTPSAPPRERRKSSRSMLNSGTSLESDQSSKKVRNELCTICNRSQRSNLSGERGRRTLYRISEMRESGKISRASLFLSAIKYNKDDVFDRNVFLNSVGDVFAADIMYHAECMRTYLSTYDRKVNTVKQNSNREDSEILESTNEMVNSILESLDLTQKCYTVTEITEVINKNPSLGYNNRATRHALICLHGDTIGFSYPKDKSKPAIVYSRNVGVPQIIEGALRHDAIEQCAHELNMEIKDLDFSLSSTLSLSSDLSISLKEFLANPPEKLMRFFERVFYCTLPIKSEAFYHHFAYFVQYIYFNKTKKPTPFHTGITEFIHSLTKSRDTIDMLNRLGICVSYDAMKRNDMAIVSWITESTGTNRCPVNESIVQGCPIQGAMDNFNHIERTPTGSSVSNDTVLVIYQNKTLVDCETEKSFSIKKPELKRADMLRALEATLPCQHLIEAHLPNKTAELPQGFDPIAVFDNDYKSSTATDYFLWLYSRYFGEPGQGVPSFIATMSRLERPAGVLKLTSKSFIPILPHPATSLDSILTTMVNFQDVLKQRNEPYGALWCDEGVYCLAKEIQLLKFDEFKNIFLGLGPFHYTKIVCSMLGKFLKPSGIAEALVNSGLYGKGVVESKIMNGGDYVVSKEGMALICEAMTTIMFNDFKCSEKYQTFVNNEPTAMYSLESSVALLKDNVMDKEKQIDSEWASALDPAEGVLQCFKTFLEDSAYDNNYAYWTMFILKLYPVLRDFELSVRQGDWNLFLDAQRKCLPLFFAAGKHNYARYGTLFHQDCLSIQLKYPMLFKHFTKDRGFVCYMTRNNSSGIGFDQALEKTYNYTSKAAGGIIGFTRTKKAVALWDIIRHQKDLYVSFMKDSTATSSSHQDGELNSVHHEFSHKVANRTLKNKITLVNYIREIGTPFSEGSSSLINVVTKEIVSDWDYYIEFIEFGKQLYSTFLKERCNINTRSVTFHAPLSLKYHSQLEVQKGTKMSKSSKKWIKDELENTKALKYLQYATLTGRNSLDYMLQYELTSRPLYLFVSEKNSLHLRKSDKSALTRELLKSLNSTDVTIGDDEGCPCIDGTAVVVDFMSVTRRLAAVKMNLKDTPDIGSFSSMILNLCIKYARKSKELHIILENYKDDNSPKTAERERRAAEHKGRVYETFTSKQPLPLDMDDIFCNTNNKKTFQDFFVKHCSNTYKRSSPILYLAGGMLHIPEKCVVVGTDGVTELQDYYATHEEADDRIMYSIQKIYLRHNKVPTITVVTTDTDVFVVLLYHLKNIWSGTNLYLLKKGTTKGSHKRQLELFHLNEILDELDGNVVDQLPAAHALTGCDTVGKVGTKGAMLKILKSEEPNISLLQGFGLDRLDGDMYSQAEEFLVKVVSKKFGNSITFNQLRVDLYYGSKSKTFVDLPCTSSALKYNIARAYLQTRQWLEAPFANAADILDPLEYGFEMDNNLLLPVLSGSAEIPPDVPMPCFSCTNCSKATCPCKVAKIKCSLFCGCSSSKSSGCKNLY